VSLLAASKARYTTFGADARLQAVRNLQGVIGVPFNLAEWSNRTAEAYEKQWLPADRHAVCAWDWPAIHRAGKTDPTKFDVVVWGPNDRLSCLATASLSSAAVNFRFLEGDPRPDCPFRGVRTLIVLEAIQCYGQASGRREIHVRPVNNALETLYREIYGFELATPRGSSAFYRREIA